MNQGKYIFAQLTDFLPRRVFDRIVKSHEGNKYVRSFTCWNQMLCMVFGQLTSMNSMRDLMLSLEAHHPEFLQILNDPDARLKIPEQVSTSYRCKVSIPFRDGLSTSFRSVDITISMHTDSS